MKKDTRFLVKIFNNNSESPYPKKIVIVQNKKHLREFLKDSINHATEHAFPTPLAKA
jgi:hypothetical protein